MVYSFLKLLTKVFPVKNVYAHCDIPCGIYDPHAMQMAAHTMLRMANLIQDAEKGQGTMHAIARYVRVKEDHAELCKREVMILWADYFKPEHIEKHPHLHDLVWKTLKTVSRARQGVDAETCKELLKLVQEIAEIFWETKGMQSVRQKSPYPTQGEMVYPKS